MKLCVPNLQAKALYTRRPCRFPCSITQGGIIRSKKPWRAGSPPSLLLCQWSKRADWGQQWNAKCRHDVMNVHLLWRKQTWPRWQHRNKTATCYAVPAGIIAMESMSMSLTKLQKIPKACKYHVLPLLLFCSSFGSRYGFLWAENVPWESLLHKYLWKKVLIFYFNGSNHVMHRSLLLD